MMLVYEALLSVYGSARQVDAELGHPVVWSFTRQLVRDHYPDQPDLWLPPRPLGRLSTPTTRSLATSTFTSCPENSHGT